MVKHPFKPIYDANSKVLILGSFPSVISRKKSFYYANKNNRFWKVMSNLYNEEISEENDNRIDFLLKHHIALWDVIESCEIKGSSDSSITDVKVNDIKGLLDTTDIKVIYTNGKKAEELYRKYIYPDINIESICLPSTSSANARYSLYDLINEYYCIRMNTIDSHMNS